MVRQLRWLQRGIILIDQIKQFVWTPRVKAALTASAAFAALYLAVGLGLFGFNWRGGLIWPYLLRGLFLQALLVTVAGFAAVALYVYRVKLRVLSDRSTRIRDLENELGACRKQVAAAEEAARVATEARKRAESRIAIAEANARAAEEKAKAASGEDRKFTEAKRVFARLYHPDTVRSEGLDKIIRTEVSKEYWGELERIEKGGRKK